MSSAKSLKFQKGFTLIELLMVIGILSVLVGIVLVAINPSNQFKQANDTKRQNDVVAILGAIGQYQADHNDALPAGLSSNMSSTELSSNGANICASLVPAYIAALPEDPLISGGVGITNCSSNYDTGYTIAISATNTITIAGTAEMPGVTISVSR